MATMVSTFAKGLEYSSEKDIGVTLWANMKFVFGKLDMTDDQIDANLTEFVKSLTAHRPAQYGTANVKILDRPH